MKYAVTTAAILAAGSATAGGIDRSGQGIGALFETGNYAEFSYGSVDADLTGVQASPGTMGTFGAASGDMASRYGQLGAAFKADLSEKLSYAVIFDQPFGADTAYDLGTGYYAAGTTAELNSSAITALLSYNATDNISVYGGLRYQTIDADIDIPFVSVGNYKATADSGSGTGYVLGAAYERPEIALRVALTLNSAIESSHATHESSNATGGVTGPATTTTIETPKSINLDFQSGVAANTLVFGSIRWVDWSSFNISPSHYSAITLGRSLVSYDNDSTSYSLGVGRKLNDNWSVAATLGYEAAGPGATSSNLGPSNGNRSLGLGATYTMDNVKVTAGVRYVKLGDTATAGDTTTFGSWSDNSATAFGLKVGYSF